jgi:hypothetical protein
MADAKRVSTPMSTVTATDPNEDGEAVNQREYIDVLSVFGVTWLTHPLTSSCLTRLG